MRSNLEREQKIAHVILDEYIQMLWALLGHKISIKLILFQCQRMGFISTIICVVRVCMCKCMPKLVSFPKIQADSWKGL